MVIVNEASAGDIVEFVLVLLGEAVWRMATGVFSKFFIDTFLGGFFEHIGTDINSDNFIDSFVR